MRQPESGVVKGLTIGEPFTLPWRDAHGIVRLSHFGNSTTT